MSNRKKVASVAFTGAAATLAVGFGTLPAHAASSWHIKNGGTGYTGHVEGKTTTSGVLTSSHGTSLVCLPGKAAASASVSKSNVPGKPATIAKIKNAAFTSCSTGGIRFNATATASLVASNYNAGTGVTTGKLTNIHATLTGIGNNCKATITGTSLPGSYSNTNHNLTADPTGAMTLTVQSATGCGGLLAGAKANFEATYHISTPGALTISFP